MEGQLWVSLELKPFLQQLFSSESSNLRLQLQIQLLSRHLGQVSYRQCPQKEFLRPKLEHLAGKQFSCRLSFSSFSFSFLLPEPQFPPPVLLLSSSCLHPHLPTSCRTRGEIEGCHLDQYLEGQASSLLHPHFLCGINSFANTNPVQWLIKTEKKTYDEISEL